MKRNFIRCGTLGWCLEIFWTGLHTLQTQDYRLMGHSSLWMFPIYGMAACISPISKLLQEKKMPLFARGIIYTAGIFLAEYGTGFILKKFNICPWDYTGCPGNIQGLIRLDYAPVWFCTGILYEKILSVSPSTGKAPQVSKL